MDLEEAQRKIDQLEAVQLVHSSMLAAIFQSSPEAKRLAKVHLQAVASSVLASESSERKASLVLELVDDYLQQIE